MISVRVASHFVMTCTEFELEMGSNINSSIKPELCTLSSVNKELLLVQANRIISSCDTLLSHSYTAATIPDK